MKSIPLLSALAFFLMLANVQASFYATTNKMVYLASDNLTVTGNITNSMAAVNMTAVVSNSTPVAFYEMSANTTGSNLFSLSHTLSGLSSGTYTINVSDGSATISLRFEVVSQITYLEAHLINTQDIRSVDTSSEISTNNAMGGNFTELRDLSISGTLHYGNITLDRLYHFVLVDQNYNLTYDTLYVDDDIRFELYNDTEDSGQNSSTEKMLQKGQKLGDYMVGEIEFNTGNRVVLGKPKGSSVYSPGSAVNFIVMAKDPNKNFVPGETVQVRLLNSSKGVISTITNTTNEMGFFTANFTAPSGAGTYIIDLNNSKGTGFFTVESFKLSGKVTDMSDNPASSITPNSVARVYAYSRDADGNAVNLTSGTVRITYPNGNTVSSSLTQSETGLYYYDFSIGSLSGSYGVKVTGSYGSSDQEFITGFSVESVSVQITPMNMNFIDQAESGAGDVNAFAPQDNVTLIVFLSNISAGGAQSNGPEGMGLIDIDNVSTGTDECGALVSLAELRDDRGASVAVPGALIMNLSRAIAMAGVSLQEQPPQVVMRQCVIIFAAPNRTGTYQAVAQVNYNNDLKKAGATFGIQRLYAEGASVDSKGDDYWFFAPNTTMKIKLKIKDLSTRQDLPAENITGAKIIEMHKEFPDFQDIFTPSFRASANESVQSGNLVFNAPDAEGFFSLKFKFRALVNGTEETGIGNAFFQLKKYMIWATPKCSQESGGPCISGMGKNITLTVNAIDIDQGSMMTQMGKGTSSLTCTNCDSLVVDVSSLRNDQLMKEMVKDADYEVVKGVVSNATAEITIVPKSSKMQSGWYGLDLIVTDPADESRSYFGWGGFEIRNLYVDTMKIDSNGTALFASWDKGGVFEKDGSVAFAAVAKDPSTGDMLTISSATFESLKWLTRWPPPEIPNSTFSISISTVPVYIENNPGPVSMKVVNISGLNKEGDFQANVRVSTSKGSDIGSFFFRLSSYRINAYYRGMNDWKPMFSSSENLTVNFTALNFDYSPHGLSLQGTKLKGVYDQKTKTPVKLSAGTICSTNYCSISANLSSLQSGWYSAEYVINDSQGYEKQEYLEFMVQNMMFGIPSIEQAGVWYSDTPSKDIEVNNDRDRCDNQRGFNGMFVAGLWNNSQAFCIQASGEWNFQTCGGGMSGTNITVLGNGSMLRIGATNYSAGASFSAAGKSWTIVSIDNNGQFRVNITNGICGEMWTNCGNQGCQQSGYVMVPPVSSTTFYHGFTENLVGSGDFDRVLSRSQNRSLYFYHNTSYLWISINASNMTQLGGPFSITGTFSDSYGGQWKVNSISKTRVKLTGVNVLAQTGAYINISNSKSGVIKIGRIEEQYLGGWDKSSGQNRGLDLDGDGSTNSFTYIAISDSQTAGIYDTFFFFNQTGEYNFSTTLSVSDTNPSNRVFGLNDTVTLLSIDPRADTVRFYSNKIGDWADLGDFRITGNVSIPIFVKTPAGNNAQANVSIQSVRVRKATTNNIYTLNPVPNTTINGAGELIISNISQYGFGAGEYVFEIKVKQGNTEEILEEWKWPRASPRVFLVDGYTGQAGYSSGFKQLPISRYDGEIFGEVQDIYTLNWTQAGKFFKAVFDFASPGEQVQNLASCNFMKPPAAGNNNNNATYRSSKLTNPQYFYYITAANDSWVWIKSGDCNFTTGAIGYNSATTPTINVTKNGRMYMMKVLDANTTAGDVVIGIKDTDFPNSIYLNPVSVRSSGGGGGPSTSNVWYILGINISGTDYNILLSNASVDYPMCSVWNVQDCVKMAWFSTSASFSAAIPAFSGDNFTSQLYLTKVGPGPWEGVSIGNFSSLGSLPRPAIDVRVKDGTTSYYGVISEAGLNLDLNMDGAKNATFYAVVYDDLDDGQQALNRIVVDDDLNITEEWWSESNTNSNVIYRKDFYTNESGEISEKSGSLPSSIWSGNVQFGERNESLSWEQQPEWRIEKYNGTDMLLMKDEWQIASGRNITILTRAYNFDQSPIQGAGITITSIKGNIPGMGFKKLEQGVDYILPQMTNITNQDGYAILKIAPLGQWSGEYMVEFQTGYNANTETTSKWFRVV